MLVILLKNVGTSKGMMKLKNMWIWIMVGVVAISIGFGIGVFITREEPKMGSNSAEQEELEAENIVENEVEISETSTAEEEKVTPNTLMIYKTYHTKCQHYINEYENADASDVNLTEEDLREKYREWNITSFNAEQVVLERETEDFCNEHYKLKIVDGKIVIYRLDEKDKEVDSETTEITTEYLTEEDILQLKEGITVYGKENLTAVLEDYE